MYQVDLNCDLGESFGAYKIGMDEEVIPLISSANIACGFHASDPVVMEKTVALCAANGIGMGAHPGFPDLKGFGRREMKLKAAEVKLCKRYAPPSETNFGGGLLSGTQSACDAACAAFAAAVAEAAERPLEHGQY